MWEVFDGDMFVCLTGNHSWALQLAEEGYSVYRIEYE